MTSWRPWQGVIFSGCLAINSGELIFAPDKEKAVLYLCLCAFEMAKVIETIVISSGEENEDLGTKEVSDRKNIIDLTTSPSYRISTSKLKALRKSRKERNRLRSTTNMHNNETAAINVLTESPKESPIKSSPSKLLQIDRTKLKELRAVVRIHLERSPNTIKSLIRKEKSVKLYKLCIN